MRTIGLVALVVFLAGCAGLDRMPTPVPTPTGDPFEQPQGDPASGPVVDIGDGSAFETAWRYAMYPTDEGWCAQLEAAGSVDARCEGVLPEDGEVLGSVGVRTVEESGATVVDVVATTEVATVWLVSGPSGRVPAAAMPVPDEVEGQAWVGVLPADAPLTHVQAVAFNGDVLQTVDLRD